MFTGIIESLGKVVAIEKEGTNLHFTIASEISSELKIDQSVSHNGVCLTVIALKDHTHKVTAIDETLQKSNLGQLTVGATVNLERCMLMNGRLDGHIVQGHVDTSALCLSQEVLDGSYKYTFSYTKKHPHEITVEKGSVCINGVSLTVVASEKDSFSVFIIPFTYEHTNFKQIIAGSKVNLEFDIIGKYVAKLQGL